MRRGREAEYDSSYQGQQCGKHEHLCVHADRLGLRNGCRHERLQDADPGQRDEQAKASAEQRQ